MSPSLGSFLWPPRCRLIIGHLVRLPSSLLSVLVLHLVARLLVSWRELVNTSLRTNTVKLLQLRAEVYFLSKPGTNKETNNSLQSATESKNLLLFLWEDVCNHTDWFYTFTLSDFLNTRFNSTFHWNVFCEHWCLWPSSLDPASDGASVQSPVCLTSHRRILTWFRLCFCCCSSQDVGDFIINIFIFICSSAGWKTNDVYLFQVFLWSHRKWNVAEVKTWFNVSYKMTKIQD